MTRFLMKRLGQNEHRTSWCRTAASTKTLQIAFAEWQAGRYRQPCRISPSVRRGAAAHGLRAGSIGSDIRLTLSIACKSKPRPGRGAVERSRCPGASQPLATRGRSTVRRLQGHGWAERAGGLREGKAACTNRLEQRDRRRQPVSRRPTRLVEAAIGRSPGRLTARIAARRAFAPAGRGRISVLTMVCALRKRELD